MVESKPDISIWQAVELGDLTSLQYFLNHSSDTSLLVNTRDPATEYTLLHIAVSSHQNPYRLLEILLQEGAEPTIGNVYNIQPIHALFLHCPKPLASLQLLLDFKADPNACDGDGWTPLHYASRFCNEPKSIIQLLLKHGANVNAIDSSRKSPLFSLLANGDHRDTLDILLCANANIGLRADFLDPKTRRTKPATVLFQSAKYARHDCLCLLLEASSAHKGLREAVTTEEIDLAANVLRQQYAQALENERRTDASHVDLSLMNKPLPQLASDRLADMLHNLNQFSLQLKHDPRSSVYRDLHPAQPIVHRRRSLMESFRRRPTMESIQTRPRSLFEHMGNLWSPRPLYTEQPAV
ncbi:ankyrin repeat-containing domain protein [Phycomyces blakesleeanus]